MSTVFSLYDTRELRRLLEDAGFDVTSVRACRKSLRLAPPVEFLWQYVSSTPLAPAVTRLDQHDRTSLERDVAAEWERFTDHGALVLELNVVTASARAT